MSLLSGLSEQKVELAQEADVLGGQSGPIPSGLYSMAITMAYLSKSAGGALGLTVWGEAQLPNGGTREIKQTEYVTSGDAKGNKKFYVAKDGASKPLPGYSWANNLCILANETPLEGVETAIKTVKIYNYDAGQEMPEDKEVLVGLIGKKVIAGVQHQLQNKNAKNQNTGSYEPTYDDQGNPVTKELNVIDKMFHAVSKQTVAEAIGNSPASFYDKWDAKFSGEVVSKLVKGSAPVKAANSGAFTGSPAAAPQPVTSLFSS
tara:strand:- start:43 stop:825 length:783 start_codon:yes stop_codon:yes gene_type:complete